jgi:hypothetical protein
MKNTIRAVLVTTLILSCKTEDKNEVAIDQELTEKKEMVDLSQYPDRLQDVLTAHGSLSKWSEMKSLTYIMGDQETITDLKTRDIVVKSPTHTIGSKDGKVWIDQDSTHFPEARARFYHNLMFYFYAMPFIVADDGIMYNDVNPLDIQGTTYLGIKIGFQANIGDAPDDNYIIYYHPENKKMEWLAYTVTYGKEGKSDQYSYIKYNKWQEVNGLLLPQELIWYKVEQNKPTVPQGTPRVFTKVDIDAANMDVMTFAKPENGVFVDE